MTVSPEPRTLSPPRPMELDLEMDLLEGVDVNGDAVWSYASCPDVEECRLGLHTCHPSATCVNTPTSYECHCERGFTGDGEHYCNQTWVIITLLAFCLIMPTLFYVVYVLQPDFELTSWHYLATSLQSALCKARLPSKVYPWCAYTIPCWNWTEWMRMQRGSKETNYM